MKRRPVWLEIGIIVVGIALMAAWMRPRADEMSPTPSPQSTTWNTQGLRFVGKNARGFEEYENLEDGTVLIKIPGGTFTMGSNDREDEKPPHRVTLPACLLARVPVTNSQFARFVSATSHDAGSDWKQYASEWGEQAPVVCVSWNDATAYCTWAGLRLPTEEEWEYAARGPQSLVYPWGNAWDPSRCRNSEGSNGRTDPVGSFPSGASPFGCLDMTGSVWQWTSSWYDRYPGNTTSHDMFGQKVRVLRGGAWGNYGPTLFRGAYRDGVVPVDRYINNGWRCARTL